jgi:hypothetical protein
MERKREEFFVYESKSTSAVDHVGSFCHHHWAVDAGYVGVNGATAAGASITLVR